MCSVVTHNQWNRKYISFRNMLSRQRVSCNKLRVLEGINYAYEGYKSYRCDGDYKIFPYCSNQFYD